MPFKNPFARNAAPGLPAVQNMTLEQFTTLSKADPSYAAFEAKFGRAIARDTILLLYDRNIRMMTANAWSLGAADYNRPAMPNAMLRVPDAQMPNFTTMLGEYFRQDVQKANGRELYLSNLKGTVLNGQLRARLTAATEPVANYYNTPQPVQRPGAPVIPAKPAQAVNRNRAIAWISGSATGASAQNSPYRKAIDDFGGGPAAIPVLTIETLKAIGRLLVTDAPYYRAVNIMQPTKYPSSLIGESILRDRLTDMATSPLPPQGDDQWYAWALYIFASIMTTQGFTDGNKRVSRTAYAIMLLKGGVAFEAPTATLGAQLGDM